MIIFSQLKSAVHFLKVILGKKNPIRYKHHELIIFTILILHFFSFRNVSCEQAIAIHHSQTHLQTRAIGFLKLLIDGKRREKSEPNEVFGWLHDID